MNVVGVLWILRFHKAGWFNYLKLVFRFGNVMISSFFASPQTLWKINDINYNSRFQDLESQLVISHLFLNQIRAKLCLIIHYLMNWIISWSLPSLFSCTPYRKARGAQNRKTFQDDWVRGTKLMLLSGGKNSKMSEIAYYLSWRKENDVWVRISWYYPH